VIKWKSGCFIFPLIDFVELYSVIFGAWMQTAKWWSVCQNSKNMSFSQLKLQSVGKFWA